MECGAGASASGAAQRGRPAPMASQTSPSKGKQMEETIPPREIGRSISDYRSTAGPVWVVSCRISSLETLRPDVDGRDNSACEKSGDEEENK